MGNKHPKKHPKDDKKKKKCKDGSSNAKGNTHARAGTQYTTELKEPEVRLPNKHEIDDLIEMRILKLYSLIKEEVDLTTSEAVLNHLHSSRTIHDEEYNRIKKCWKRKDAIEMLLQTVLMGSKEMQDAFKHALISEEQRANKRHRISKKLDEVEIMDNEVKVYQAVYSGKTDTFQDIPKDVHTKCEIHVASFSLEERTFVEMMDTFLSRFSISFAEYSNIMGVKSLKKRLVRLQEVMSRRPVEVYEDLLLLFHDLETNNDKAIATNITINSNVENTGSLKRKRVYAGSTHDVVPVKLRRVCDPSIEQAILSNADASQEIKSKAEKIGLQYESSFKGSIVLRFLPIRKDSWDILRKECEDGKIANFSKYLLKHIDKMKEGEYPVNFKILRKPQSDGAGDIVEFHWEDAPDDCKRSRLQENLDLLEEELEINEKLMDYLKENHIVDAGSVEAIDEIEGRRSRNMFLLKHIENHGEKGYDILKNYIKEANEPLHEIMNTNEQLISVGEQFDRTASVSSNTRSKTKYLVYSATLIIDIVKQDSDSVRGSKRKRKSSRVVIRDVLNPILNFEKETTVKRMSAPPIEIERTLEEYFRAESGESIEKQGSVSKKKKKDKSIPVTSKTQSD